MAALLPGNQLGWKRNPNPNEALQPLQANTPLGLYI